jgi:hypothetical protein
MPQDRNYKVSAERMRIAQARGPRPSGLSGLQVVIGSSTQADIIRHRLQLNAPPGKIAISGGVDVDAPGNAFVESILPIITSGKPTGWFFVATRTGGDFSWHINGWIICVDDPGTVAPVIVQNQIKRNYLR